VLMKKMSVYIKKINKKSQVNTQVALQI